MRATFSRGLLALALAGSVACTEDPGPTSTAWDPDDDGAGESTSGGPSGDSSSSNADESSASTDDGGSTSDVGESTSGAATETGEGDCPRVRTMTPGDVLNVRPTPDTSMAPVGMLPDGSVVTKVAEVMGEAVNGNTTWLEIDSQSLGLHGFVSEEFVSCTTDPET
jgi:hypothetical protein